MGCQHFINPFPTPGLFPDAACRRVGRRRSWRPTVAVPDKTATDNPVQRVEAEMLLSGGLVSNVRGRPPAALAARAAIIAARAHIHRSQCHAMGHEARPAG